MFVERFPRHWTCLTRTRYNPIEEDDFYQTIFREIYGLSTRNAFDSHCVAVLYSVLALGTLMDLEEPANSHQATRYYHLGRTALSVDSIFEEQSIPAIQALASAPPSNLVPPFT
jgi:hypothetical protein